MVWVRRIVPSSAGRRRIAARLGHVQGVPQVPRGVVRRDVERLEVPPRRSRSPDPRRPRSRRRGRSRGNRARPSWSGAGGRPAPARPGALMSRFGLEARVERAGRSSSAQARGDSCLDPLPDLVCQPADRRPLRCGVSSPARAGAWSVARSPEQLVRGWPPPRPRPAGGHRAGLGVALRERSRAACQ